MEIPLPSIMSMWMSTNVLATFILYLSPVVAIILLFGQPATYGKLDGRIDYQPTTLQQSRLHPPQGPSSCAIFHWLGPMVSSKWSWMIFESPCWIWTVVLWNDQRQQQQDRYYQPWTMMKVSSSVGSTPKAHVMGLLSWFSLHYLYRSLCYPMKISNHSKMPVGISLMAFCYNSLNGYLQVSDLMDRYSSSQWTVQNDLHQHHHHPSLQFFLGIMLGMLGFAMSYHSDEILLKLKKNQKKTNQLSSSSSSSSPPARNTPDHRDYRNYDHHHHHHHHRHYYINGNHCKYQIPHGGMFRFVSSPHYLGEIMEWMGFCLACNVSLASLSFLVWTCANLIPRAYTSHQWYNQHFSDQYPLLYRKAIIPGLF
jgi:3-oxo-5-alpha-steroid 4-dehydrogenase 1